MPSREIGDAWALHGPLGADNMKRQQGRSLELGDPRGERRATLVFTGTPNKSALPIGDAMASALTVTCSLDQIAGELRGTVRGLVKWGSDGHQTECAFDWVNGTVVQVVGSFVEVQAHLIDGAEDTVVRVGAFIGYYAANRMPATHTSAIDVLASPDAGTVLADLPRFASRLHVAAPVATQAFTATFLDAAGAALAQYANTAFVGIGRVPVPNGAVALRVTSGGAAFRALAIFELSI